MLRLHISSTAVPTLVSGPPQTADWVITSLTFIFYSPFCYVIHISCCHRRTSILRWRLPSQRELQKGLSSKSQLRQVQGTGFFTKFCRACQAPPHRPASDALGGTRLGFYFHAALQPSLPWILDLYRLPVHIAVTRVTVVRVLSHPFLNRARRR